MAFCFPFTLVCNFLKILDKWLREKEKVIYLSASALLWNLKAIIIIIIIINISLYITIYHKIRYYFMQFIIQYY